MTTELESLSCRAVACKNWRWKPGTLDQYGYRILEVHEDGTVTTSDLIDRSRGYESYQEHEQVKPESISLLPDLSDSGTFGCLLALVREAWGLHRGRTLITWQGEDDQWCVGWAGRIIASGSSEVEALVVALETSSNRG